ncbi:hypothetical protein CR513_10056, partial [Mucuna pruriens]
MLRSLDQYVDINTASSRIRVGSMMVNSLGGSSTDQVRVKAGSEIPSTTVPTTAATTCSIIGQFTFDGRVDEIPAKFKCHDSRSENAVGQLANTMSQL